MSKGLFRPNVSLLKTQQTNFSHGSMLPQIDCTAGKTTTATLFPVFEEEIRKVRSSDASFSTLLGLSTCKMPQGICPLDTIYTHNTKQYIKLYYFGVIVCHGVSYSITSTNSDTMFTKDLPGGYLRRKMKMRAQLKILRCNVITLRN